MPQNVAPDALGRRRSTLDGRFQGRFVYTDYNPLGLGTDVRTHRSYLVHRVSDGRFLGSVHHRIGTSWWTSQPVDSPESLAGRQSRREWATDQLDAHSQLNLWCGCGISVGKHDRPTRAAMRAWASWDDARGNPQRDSVAWQAAYHARIRGRHYDLTGCVDHARLFAGPVAVGHAVMVVPDTGPVHRVLMRPDAFSGGIEIRHWIGEQHGEAYLWPNPEHTLEYLRSVYEARGYKPVHDWRS